MEGKGRPMGEGKAKEGEGSGCGREYAHCTLYVCENALCNIVIHTMNNQPQKLKHAKKH